MWYFDVVGHDHLRFSSFINLFLHQFVSWFHHVLFCNYFKISSCTFTLQKQARRVYEILRLKATNVHDSSELTKFRLEVKNRLNQPFQVCITGYMFIHLQDWSLLIFVSNLAATRARLPEDQSHAQLLRTPKHTQRNLARTATRDSPEGVRRPTRTVRQSGAEAWKFSLKSNRLLQSLSVYSTSLLELHLHVWFALFFFQNEMMYKN